MAVRFKTVEKEPVQLSVQPQKNAELNLLMSEYLNLETDVLKAKNLIKKADKLKAQLQEFVDPKAPKGEDFILKSDAGSVTFSKCAETRIITDMGKLLEFLEDKIGNEALVKILSLPLGELDTYLSKAEQKDFVEEKSGSRRLIKTEKFN